MKRLVAVASLVLGLGCGGSPFENGNVPAADPAQFVGVWRSVTPSFEFVGLSVFATSQPGVLAARLTLSGIALDATGRIEADSLVATTTTGSGQPAGTLALRALADHTLSAELRPNGGGTAQNLAFVRE